MTNKTDERKETRRAHQVSIAVVGSVNLDLVAAAPKLPAPGETVTGAVLSRYPGGKGANQALAARRLGASVALCAMVGRDDAADEALALLRAEGVELSGCIEDPEAATGVAFITVAPDGENQIVVAPGANAAFTPDKLPPFDADAVICQLEIPMETVAAAAKRARYFCLNAAPARPLPPALIQQADLVVVNETEAAFYGDALAACSGLVAVTLGRAGARLIRRGVEVASAAPPQVDAVDATGAGDAFTAALAVSLVKGFEPEASLRRACAAGALAATRPGAQPSFPFLNELEALFSAS
ncbi:MAG: ribokinase [Parvularculaceae bacterium]